MNSVKWNTLYQRDCPAVSRIAASTSIAVAVSGLHLAYANKTRSTLTKQKMVMRRNTSERTSKCRRFGAFVNQYRRRFSHATHHYRSSCQRSVAHDSVQLCPHQCARNPPSHIKHQSVEGHRHNCHLRWRNIKDTNHMEDSPHLNMPCDWLTCRQWLLLLSGNISKIRRQHMGGNEQLFQVSAIVSIRTQSARLTTTCTLRKAI